MSINDQTSINDPTESSSIEPRVRTGKSKNRMWELLEYPEVRAALPTGILILGAGLAEGTPASHQRTCMLRRLNGALGAPPLTQRAWEQCCLDLEASMLPGVQDPIQVESVGDTASSLGREGVTPIFIVDVAYDYPSLRALRMLRKAIEGCARPPRADEVRGMFSRGRAFFGSAVLSRTATTQPGIQEPSQRLQAKFLYKPEFFLSNGTERPESVEIDFDDGNGLRTIVPGAPVDVTYLAASEKLLRYRCRYRDGSVRQAASRLPVQEDDPIPDAQWGITATIPYRDRCNTGTAFIAYGTEWDPNERRARKHTQLTHPVLVLEPYPGHFTYAGFVEKIARIMPTMLSAGFDLVLLAQDDPGDYLQRSAFVTLSCIQRIADERSRGRPLIILGLHMGALVARYALAYMERHGLQHDVGCYVSWDGPHRGMNIPVSVQWMAQQLFQCGGYAKDQVEQFNRISTRQMLLYYAVAGEGEHSLIDPLHPAFYAELRDLGFPSVPLNIAVSTGKRDGVPVVPYQAKTIDWSGSLWVGGDTWTLPERANDWVSVADLSYKFTDYTLSVLHTEPFDSAPGFLFDAFQQLAHGLKTADKGDVTCVYANACVVPLVSALDTPQADLFLSIDHAVGSDEKNLSPFDLFIIAPQLTQPTEGGTQHLDPARALMSVLGSLPDEDTDQTSRADGLRKEGRSV